MIDHESEIFNRLYDVLKKEFESIEISSEMAIVPAKFPLVIIEQVSNTDVKSLLDSSFEPKFANFVININIYSNLKTGKKLECKKIARVIDEEMHRMNCLREAYAFIPTENRASRLLISYKGQASNKNFYRP